MVALSSAKAEYRSMASTVIKLTWLTFLLQDLCIPFPHPPILHCDNVSALHLSVNPVFHAQSKHIALDFHYVCEQVALKTLETRFVPSELQLAALFTKPLAKLPLGQLRIKLCLCVNSRHSLRGDDNLAYEDSRSREPPTT